MTAALLRLLLPVLVLAAIWFPEWHHGRIDRSPVAPSAITASVPAPADDVLRRIAAIDLAELDDLPPAPAEVARQVAQGWLDWPTLQDQRVRLAGYPDDYLAGPPNLRLFMASLAIENLLLRGHASHGDVAALEAALERTLQMARHERALQHDRTFLWNDHAVASRVSVMVELWRLLRQRPALLQQHGEELLSFARRTGHLLAKADHFTVRTNHGVMQNLALLQLSAAFPAWPEAAAWRQLALDRLALQLRFYLSPEGAVLEHSSGYHAMGHRLLGYARTLRALNGLPADPALDAAHAAAAGVLGVLARPDGSLPLVGNTSTAVHGPQRSAVAQPTADWWPVAGWAVWRTPDEAGESHVMLAWSKHDGHGHKRPDEASVHLWSSGVDWITASGYWPYGDGRFKAAYSWLASNAVHAPGESGRSPRTTQLLAQGAQDTLRFADLDRAAAGTHFRRQVVQLDAATVLVVDFVSGAAAGSETLWTVDPDLTLAQHAPGLFRSTPAPDGRQLTLALASPQAGGQTSLLSASNAPFGGWVVIDGRPRPASSVRWRQPASASATVTLLHVGRGEPAAITSALEASAQPEQWQATLRLNGADVTVRRAGATLQVASEGTAPLALPLQAPAPIDNARATLRQAYADATAQYPPWRDLWRFRVKLSPWVVGAGVGIELAFALAAWRWRARITRWRRPAWWLLAAAWALAGWWLSAVYLRA
jgi:hypothetical protein